MQYGHFPGRNIPAQSRGGALQCVAVLRCVLVYRVFHPNVRVEPH
jgi:hypothetical protein